ncbi:5'-methylthioadenosine/adenosylhomocysteine nucleosidase [Aerococcaceae bacterium DSM 111020]|nr:5'-methylthioadenosine/adenosylhomocysteine nucleosidase [Aerococcaceae bacterium DSM 111020]
MKLGIIGAMAEEIAHLKRQMTIDDTVPLHGMIYYTGQLHQVPIVLVESGIGKVNATISTAVLIEHFEVTAIINTGTAGAADPALRIGDVVIGDYMIHHDVDVRGFGYQPGQMAGMPEGYFSDSELIHLAQKVIRTQGIEPVRGTIVSGDEFVNSTERVEAIREQFPKARACEMESAAIAQTAYVMETPFVIIRVISDTADQSAALTFDEFVLTAGRHSAQMVQELIFELSKGLGDGYAG